MKTTEASARADSGEQVCANCGHPRSDHPMHDACWHTVTEDKRTRLCSCRGYKSPLQAVSLQDNQP
jgi:hypothetical protein